VLHSAIDNPERARQLGAVAVLALGVILAGSRRWIGRPVDLLLGVTRRVAAGDLAARSGPPYPAGEMGELARSFDVMADRLGARDRTVTQAQAALREANERLEARVAERTARLHALIDATRRISLMPEDPARGAGGHADIPVLPVVQAANTPRIDRATAEVAKAAATLTGASRATLWLVDEQARLLHVRAVFDERPDRVFRVQTLAYGESAVGWVAENRANLVIADIREDERIARPEWWLAHGLRTLLAVPIVWRGQVLGVLSLSGPEPSAFGQEAQDTAEAFAAQAAIALRNVILYETARAAGEAARAANSPTSCGSTTCRSSSIWRSPCPRSGPTRTSCTRWW